VLRAVGDALALAAGLLVTLPARSAAADQGSVRSAALDRELPAPSAAEAGWFGVSVGIGSPRLQTTLGSAEPSGGAEGSVGSAGNYRLHYEKQLLRWVGVRGFVSSTEWGTDQSEHSGDGDRALYDVGGAPILSFSAIQGRHGLSLFAFAPISFSWSSAPARAERQVVLESMNVGTGYRFGFGVGLLCRLSGRLGLLFELEWAKQHVSHLRRYARLDGSGDETELPITYDLRWLGVEVGLAVFP
jgi:hypothetical protein